MPFIRISLAGKQPSAEQIQHLQSETTRLMAEILNKRPEVTVVAVEFVPGSNWSIGGLSLQQSSKLGHMEAFITAGTNSEQEKADFIAAAYQMLTSVLGQDCTPVYVVVIDIDAANWGYDGQTQAARKLAAQML